MNNNKYRPIRERSTVLLIGDGLGVLKEIAFALQHAGHSILWAESGRTGLRTVECEQPDLVISEIDIPDISGIDVCREIKAASYTFHIPMVLIGPHGDELQQALRAFRAGADEFLVGFNERRLTLAKLEWLMQKRKSSQYQLGRNEYFEKLLEASVEYVR